MPLRDHFRPPLDDQTTWEALHGGWPMVIVQKLNPILPQGYVSEPRVHVGAAFEIDVSAYEKDPPAGASFTLPGIGVEPTATWSPAQPTLVLDAEVPVPSEYEVLVYDVSRRRRLVAAIEIVSPGNKDRLENRRAFVHKCEALLKQNVYVVIVDLVTIRTANLSVELAEIIGGAESAVRGPIYVVGYRAERNRSRWRVEAWPHELVLGQPLPTLPLWLSDRLYVPLDLESSYEDTCRALLIA